ncbi:glutaredoxin family protein [Shewanella sp. WXL01]|uniref:Glutaredoxin family protein n=1 Tax=Shewanella maritima TaxID=2520507 RepID=A0A411PKQ3_9GAMM|nr:MULTISPECIES: glutaredoxin family protein [Shewanella]NKF51160.1 glutaredoxin family protein [Shewanella sp. WXL01]QBF84109.1 glutaredoxin family protein [Shewanella maritima]
MNNNRFRLYHTDGCHLCELAQALIEQALLEGAQVSYQLIDICDQQTLADKYGTSIPVFSDGQRDLNWPFDLEQLQQFIGSSV